MEKFKFITHDIRNPYFNLASEEYLLKGTDGYYFYLWINDPAVIVGVNQNAIEEVNQGYVNQNGIKVVRRLTGGGAVYHDGGNLCYTVIAPYNPNENGYLKFTAPVIEYLNQLGVNACFGGRNDILVDGKKISGNAQTVYNGRVMHHGTLLFDTDTNVLTSALNPNKLKMQSKGIKSVRSRVVNLKEYLPDFTVGKLKDGLKEKFLTVADNYEFNQVDINAIEKLVAEKYSRYEWNIGRSPKGKNVLNKKFPFGIITLTFDTNNGVIENAQIHGDFFSLKELSPLENALNGVKFEKESVCTALKNVDEYISGADSITIANALFE